MATDTVLIVGNTYPVREALKALGGRWDKAANGWRVPAAKADEARALLPQPAARPTGRSAAAIRRAGGLCPECGDDCGGTWECGYA